LILESKLKRIVGEFKEAEMAYTQKKENPKELLYKAEALAPKEYWHDRLDQSDLPGELGGVELALVEAKVNVKTIAKLWKKKVRYYSSGG